MLQNYQVAFLSDATGTFDYPDVAQGALSAADVHRATLTILAFSTADVMTVDEFKARVVGANVAAANKAASPAEQAASNPDFEEQNPGSKPTINVLLHLLRSLSVLCALCRFLDAR